MTIHIMEHQVTSVTKAFIGRRFTRSQNIAFRYSASEKSCLSSGGTKHPLAEAQVAAAKSALEVLLLWEEFGYRNSKAGQMRLRRQVLQDVEQDRRCLWTMHGDCAQIGIDDPHECHAGAEVQLDLLDNFLMLVGWRQDFDGEYGSSIDE